jgi:hypothetical protein
MVNNDMNVKFNNTRNDSIPAASVPKKPNEAGSIRVDAHVKIFDPVTKEVFVEKRA